MTIAARTTPAAERPPSIAELISLGDHRAALSRCAAEHGAAIGRLCMALLGSQAEAEEHTQETLLAAYDGFATWRGEGDVRAWLFGIARRRCARRLATRQRRAHRLRLLEGPQPPGTPVDEHVHSRRQAEAIRGALEQLEPSLREAVVLRYQSGLSYREIAEICGVNEAAARKRTSRALARLRVIMNQEAHR